MEPADYRLHGQGFVAIFSGEFAEERAVQYAYRKNQAFFVAPPHLARSA